MTQPTTTHDVTATPQAPTAGARLPEFADDVRRFAAENGIAKYLPGLWELTERLLPGRGTTLRLDWDPEIPGDGYITFSGDAEGMTAEELLAAYYAWWDGVRAQCDRNDTHFFHFGM